MPAEGHTVTVGEGIAYAVIGNGLTPNIKEVLKHVSESGKTSDKVGNSNGTFAPDSVLTALFVISSVLAITLIVYLFLTARLSLLTSLTFAGFHLVFVCVSAVIAKVRSIK